MATLSHIRGALLEEAVLFLLRKVGYDTIDLATLAGAPLPGLRGGHSGLEAQGRGTWHQLDALCNWQTSPPFMYPLRLIVEAKCYRAAAPVQVSVVRNAVGVLKDVSENYFTFQARSGLIQGPRYNYAAAIFATSGFTKGAVEYAVAHQVFLIQYRNIPAIAPLIDAIVAFSKDHITSLDNSAISAARKCLRAALNDRHIDDRRNEVLTPEGVRHVEGAIRLAASRIHGSYFGMLQGRWPLHLLREQPLPAEAFREDTVRCKVEGNEQGEWAFFPIHADPHSPEWFELEFSLPEPIAELVRDEWDDRVAVAHLKIQHFSYLDITGVIGGIRRTVRLELDRQWITRYLRSRR